MNEQYSNEHDGRHDFDFIAGKWKARGRRLSERLKGSDTWYEVEGTLSAQLLLGGLGNLDELVMEGEQWKGYGGVTLRLFDPQTQQWSIYWVGKAMGKLQDPMIGSFKNGRGEFYDREIFDKQTIISRFIWSVLDANTARWEQAFSPDAGKTWETNWIMDFERIE
jgi:hypothetical protein